MIYTKSLKLYNFCNIWYEPYFLSFSDVSKVHQFCLNWWCIDRSVILSLAERKILEALKNNCIASPCRLWTLRWTTVFKKQNLKDINVFRVNVIASTLTKKLFEFLWSRCDMYGKLLSQMTIKNYNFDILNMKFWLNNWLCQESHNQRIGTGTCVW